jgi:digeranylgeranylglycerophospholipid reductase
MSKFDVIVVGAGPIGSFTAARLADRGLSVAIMEKQPEAGLNVICSGVIGKHPFKKYSLPRESILSEIDSFTFVSPQGQRLEYVHSESMAYVVDRSLFDRTLVERAKESGVSVLLGYDVRDIRPRPYDNLVLARDREFQAAVVILATGVDHRLHQMAGLENPPAYLYGSQVEIPFPSPSRSVEIHLGRSIAPGSFGWVIPVNNRTSRIGVIVDQKGPAWLKKMLDERIATLVRHKLPKCRIAVKPIVYGPLKKSVHDRVLAVGEAAGQVKTTTGGSISFGLQCSEILVDKVERFFDNGSRIDEYDLEWHSTLMPELNMGFEVRRVAQKITDENLERFFSFVKKNRHWVDSLVSRVNFDHHSDLLYYCIESFKFLMHIKR